MRTRFPWAALALCACAPCALCAFPAVTGVTTEVDAEARRVTINYELVGGPAIVTAEILTNGVPLPTSITSSMCLDVSRKLSDGAHKILWLPDHGTANVHLENVDVSARLTAWTPDTPPDYLVVGLAGGNDVRYYASEDALPGGVTNAIYRTTHIAMRKIPAEGARFRMGCALSETGVTYWDGNVQKSTLNRERPHMVTLTNDFWMGIYPCTQGQWLTIQVDDNPSSYKNGSNWKFRPVETVGYNTVRDSYWPVSNRYVSAICFMGKIRSQTGVDFDLPTEAEWEFACRAGDDGPLYTGKGIEPNSNISEIAWWEGNGAGSTHAVGQKIPNAWGLYDMIGNVWEWCLDWGNSALTISNAECVAPAGLLFEQTIAPNDKTEATPFGIAERVKRGGAFNTAARGCRMAFRGMENRTVALPNTGFRLVAPIGLKW